MLNGPAIRTNPTLEAMMHGQQGDDRVSLLKKNNTQYLVFRGTDFNSPQDILQNILQKGGSQSVGTDPKYNEVLKKGRRLLERAKQNALRTGGDVEIVSYSMGSHTALHLAITNPHIKTTLYHPYFSHNEKTLALMKGIKAAGSNVRVLTTREDPISQPGLKYYKDYLKVGYKKKSKYFHAHALENHYG